LQQAVRPLVVRRCDCCWDVVPRVVVGEHLTIRTLDVSSALLGSGPGEGCGGRRVLFVGNDWAEDHHDVEIVDEQGRRLARRRLPEGWPGLSCCMR
jgi:hypothetical protein